MDLAGLSALLTPQGWELLEALPPYRQEAALHLAERLHAEGVDRTLVAAALTQSRLRARAHAKFGPFADGMLFTPEGLEQATRLEVAARHAQRYVAAGVDRVADLGCGIGGDAMALAALDVGVLAVERDELTAAVATVNLRHWPHAEVRHEDATTTDLRDVRGVFLDPARRTASGRRVLDPWQAEPSWDVVLATAARVPATGVKVAPGVRHDLLPPDAETQWVSVDGDVVEAGVWFGPLARPGVTRSALLLRDGSATLVDDTGLGRPPAGPVGGYLYDPDGAVVRAGLVGQLAADVEGRLLDPTIAYVTSDRLVATPLGRAFVVEEVLPFGLKTLRTRLRDRGVGRVEILKRGSAVDVEQLRRQLRLTGPGAATVVLTRVAGRQSVLLCRPVQ
ncbi:SAM-dependent methyltransferase [Quadrisphaera sp. GCM10027208]|uniref:THUMP-like domain-containing protein n=1 Tax=Quadrisphaera sp. GCM10027208 TaxID=3273423 RepID=UPI00360C8CEF